MSLIDTPGFIPPQLRIASTVLRSLPFRNPQTGNRRATPVPILPGESFRDFQIRTGQLEATAKLLGRPAPSPAPSPVVASSQFVADQGPTPSTPASEARKETMSILADFGRTLGTGLLNIGLAKVAQRQGVSVLPGAGAVSTPPMLPSGTASINMASGILPALPTIVSGAGAVLRNPVVRAAGSAAVGAAAGMLVDDFGRPIRKRRRMNFGNAKAARRAIRRIKGTRKLLQSIERQLPRRPAPRPRATGAHTHRK